MQKKFEKVNNPLTIIAIFAALAEINATVALNLITPELQAIFIWFVIGFPTLLVLCFFITLNLNTKVLYSPSDFRDDKTFIDTLYGSHEKKNRVPHTEELQKTLENLYKSIEDLQAQQKATKTSLKKDLQSHIEKIKEEAKNLTVQIANEKDFLPVELKKYLIEYLRYPAFFMIIRALVLSGAESVEELKIAEKKYHMPDGWDEALYSFFENGILDGDEEDKFRINEEYRSSLNKWVHSNQLILKKISAIFEEDPENSEQLTRQEAINLVI